MNCQRCNSQRVVEFTAKCPDGYGLKVGGKDYDPIKIIGLCDGEYLKPKICLSCGQCQGEFPVTLSLFPEDEKQERAPHQEDLYRNIKDWLVAAGQHTCSSRKILASDMSPNYIGMICAGCGKGFYMSLSDVRKSIDGVSVAVRESMQTAKGRQELAESC